MLDRRDGHALCILDPGAEPRVRDRMPERRHPSGMPRGQVRALKDDAVIGRGGDDLEVHARAAMKADAGEPHALGKGLLHDHFRHTTIPC